MTGNELLKMLQALPEAHREYMVIMETAEIPNTSWGIDEASVLASGFITLKST